MIKCNGGMYMIQEKLGKRIRKLREGIGISQEKFALSIDMDRTYLSTVERGKTNISIGNTEKIAKGLNISLSELFKDL